MKNAEIIEWLEHAIEHCKSEKIEYDFEVLQEIRKRLEPLKKGWLEGYAEMIYQNIPEGGTSGQIQNVLEKILRQLGHEVEE